HRRRDGDTRCRRCVPVQLRDRCRRRLLDVAARRRPHVVDPLPGCTDGGDYGAPEGHQTGRPGPCAITRWPQAPVHRGGLLGPGADARGEFPVRRYDGSWAPHNGTRPAAVRGTDGTRYAYFFFAVNVPPPRSPKLASPFIESF